MLSRHVSIARATMEAPWDAARANRVLERAVDARRSVRSPGQVSAMWTVVLAGASIAAAVVAFRPVPSNGEPPAATTEPGSTVVSTPSDALDGGKHTG